MRSNSVRVFSIVAGVDDLKHHVHQRDAREATHRKTALKDFERLVAEEDKHGDFLFVDNVDVTSSTALNMRSFIMWCVRVASNIARVASSAGARVSGQLMTLTSTSS